MSEPHIEPTQTTDPGEPGGAAQATLLSHAWADLRRNPASLGAGFVVLLIVVIAIAPQWFAGWFGHPDPRVCDLARSRLGPRSGHPFGFDTQGCDVYANVIYGARASISIGLLVTATSLVLAVILGSLSGYLGGVVDTVVSRLADVFFGFPFILGALVVLTSLSTRNVLTVSGVLTLFTWPVFTRLMRSSVLAVKSMDYVTAARILGGTDWRIIRKHVLPNAVAPVLVIATITVGSVIAAEAALTFLGVGLRSSSISWGLQLAAAQEDFQSSPHLLVFPAGFLSATVLSFVVLGDTLRDALDPRLS